MSASSGSASKRTFEFPVFSGGAVRFDLDTCVRCTTKACVEACNKPNLACVRERKDGGPALRVTREAAARFSFLMAAPIIGRPSSQIQRLLARDPANSHAPSGRFSQCTPSWETATCSVPSRSAG